MDIVVIGFVVRKASRIFSDRWFSTNLSLFRGWTEYEGLETYTFYSLHTLLHHVISLSSREYHKMYSKHHIYCHVFQDFKNDRCFILPQYHNCFR